MTREIALHCMKSASELERELCEECPIYGQTGCDHCYEDALQYVIATLKQEPRWIPVSERLPEKNVEVLATTEWGAVTIAEMYSGNDWFIHEGTTNAETDEIAAWMPLPESYREVEE